MRWIFILLAQCWAFTAAPQVPRAVLVEHFTNTRCGICASRNPALYTNLDNHPEVHHLSIHPSAPYANCELHLHNPGDNDARTHQYDVYAGTPRIVIQGIAQPGNTDFGDDNLFSPYQNQLTAFSVRTSFAYHHGRDSFLLTTVIKKEGSDTTTQARLYAVLAEDVVAYQAPNGEDQHLDVMRTAVHGEQGLVIDLPEAVGDSIQLSKAVEADVRWKHSSLYCLSILQHRESLEAIQVASTKGQAILATEPSPASMDIRIWPNPATNALNIEGMDPATGASVQVMDVRGGTLLSESWNGAPLDVSDLPAGVYFLRMNCAGVVVNRPLIIAKANERRE